MQFQMFTLAPYIKSMKKNKLDINEFFFTYNDICFDVIMDISNIPFQMLLGAKTINFAVVLNVEEGYIIDFPETTFYELCNKLHLRPGKETFTSFAFLRYISSRVPKIAESNIVPPSHIMPFRKQLISLEDEVDKTVFLGWNDHKRDMRKARNFKKTELFFGKQVADFCIKNNISSIWCSSKNGKETIVKFPPNYKSSN